VSEPQDAKSTIRADTGARHHRKYASRNPVQVYVLDRFVAAAAREINRLQPSTILEFGTGEGFFLERLLQHGARLQSVLGIDLRGEALSEARERCPSCRFEQIDLLEWDQEPRSFDLVIASDVLEHLDEPGRYLERLVPLTRGHLLLTVPLEPWFQIMNLIRGRDIMRLGNHPEHVNRWSLRAFKRFVNRYAEIETAYTVFPFSLVVARPRTSRSPAG